MNIRKLLPATAVELAALLGITPKQAHGRLNSLAKSGGAQRSAQTVRNGNSGRGPHNSVLWVRRSRAWWER